MNENETFDIDIGSVVGPPGESGQDGYSPTASVSKSGKNTTITITDKTGTTTATVSDGKDGQDGQDGQDGYSPSASVSKNGKTTTITVTDKNGTTTASVSDGEDGQNGQDGSDGADGVSPEVTITTITGGHSVTITDEDHPSGQTFNVMDGVSGDDVETVTGTDPVIVAVAGRRYVCGEVATLTFTPPASGITDVVFTSGTTPTVISLLPSGEVIMPDSWETPLDASTVYELNFLNRLGGFLKWT